jgi:hypothetical protein
MKQYRIQYIYKKFKNPCFQGPRALNEALGLDRAVAAAVDLVDLKDTLILGICTVRNQTNKPLILGMHC